MDPNWRFTRYTAFHDQELNSVNYLTFQQRMFRMVHEIIRCDTTLDKVFKVLWSKFRPQVNMELLRTLRVI